jgi:hypothetical protein
MISIGHRRTWLKRRKRRRQAAAVCCVLAGFAPLSRHDGEREEPHWPPGGEVVERAEKGERARRHVRYLAEHIGPRQAGTQGERDAARYVAQVMAEQGYEVKTQEGIPVRGTASTTANVIARSPMHEGEQVVVLGAHYDSMVGDEASPGANDDGSGVAVLLEVARLLRAVRLGHEVRFVFFGAEEVGYQGARAYVRGFLPPSLGGRGETVVAMVEVDMVGVGERLWLNYAGPANGAGAGVREAAALIGVSLAEQEGNGHSDHEAFARAGIPAVWIQRLPDAANHTREDVAPRVSGPAMQQVVDLVATWAMQESGDEESGR